MSPDVVASLGSSLLLLSLVIVRVLYSGSYRCACCGARRQDLHAPDCPWDPAVRARSR